MQFKPYGHSGLTVSALGLGAGQIGDAAGDEQQVARLLNTALDLGVSLIDTARGYGLSEARIGRHLAHRRHEFVLSTKVGYGIPGFADWTAGCVSAGVDEALRLLRTEHIDIVHLHSCPLNTLQADEVIVALQRAQAQGKLGVVAYSGENEALAWAVSAANAGVEVDADSVAHSVRSGLRFGGVECSVNLFDQASLAGPLVQAQAQGQGVIAKRPLGNAPWRFAQRPVGDYCDTYWKRMQALAYDTADMPWDELALRFSAHQAAVSSAIVGTASVAHLQHNVALVNKGPLSDGLVQAIRARFQAIGAGWGGEI